MTDDALVFQDHLVNSFADIKSELEKKVHLLATDGDERLARVALELTKQLFDLGVQLEAHSHPHVHPFLASISQPTGIETRSSKKPSKADTALERVKPDDVLPHTPLSELTTDGLEPEQVWQQLELRAPGYVRVSKELVAPEEGVGRDEVELEESEDDSESGSEDMTEEEFREMLAEQGMEDLTEEEIEKMLRDAEAEGDSDEDDDDDDEEDSEDDEEEEDDDEMSGSEEEDEVTFEDGTKIGGSDEDDDDDEELELDDSDELDVEDEDEDEDMEGDEDENLLSGSELGSTESEDDEAGPSRAGPSKRRQHPTLDDSFFSIDDFNRITEEAEASHLSSGRLGEDEEEDLEEDVGDMMLRGANEDDPIMYGDFFDAPRTIEKPVGKPKVKSKDDSKGKGKGKGRKPRFEAEDDEDDDNLDNEGSGDGDEAREVMGRFKEDLFAEDDEEETKPEEVLSTHEKRQRALAEQIAQLEQEAVGPKDWTLLGEASARARPENSLLEEDLDFEHVQKVTPVITEETVKTLEELIKKRILDNDFNSTVRVRAYEPTAFLPSRYFDLQDTQSTKSLAQIYEEEYQSAAAGGKAADPRDEKLKKEHQEIEELWGEICYKLDALSSLNFVPKQPKAQITTISNLPTTSMETALPATSSTSTMLAPEELFQPATQSSLVARSELTPEEAQRQRERKRKIKKQDRKHLGDMAELYGKKKGGGVKGEKDRALEGLVKSGKGVTVVGKNGAGSAEKGRKRGNGEGGEEAREDGKRLKL